MLHRPNVGQTLRPDSGIITARTQVAPGSLIDYRVSFNDELIKTIDEL